MVLNSKSLEKSILPRKQGEELIIEDLKIGHKNAMRNVVTVYNMDTFCIGKIRVNRVITIKALMAKIAAYYEVTQIKDLIIKFGDLDIVFDAKSSEKDLNKRLFTDLAFTEANMIGVQILNKSKQIIMRKKQQR